MSKKQQSKLKKQSEVETIEKELGWVFKNVDFSKLKPNEAGVRVLATVEIAPPEEYEGYTTVSVPVVSDEATRRLKVAVMVNLPYVKKMPIDEVDESLGTHIVFSDQALLIDDETYKSFQEINDYCEMSKHEDGYDEETGTYWLDGDAYGEKDVIWIDAVDANDSLGDMNGFSANFDSYRDIYSPCDITNIKKREFMDGKRVLSKNEQFEIRTRGLKEDFFSKLLPDEEIFYLARECAKQKDSIGFAVVCKNGKFYLPVESFFDPSTCEFDHLVAVFNAIATSINHHACACLMVADIGNMSFQTAIRYAKGKIYDWHNRVNQAIRAHQQWNSEYSPYSDPYDDLDDAYFD